MHLDRTGWLLPSATVQLAPSPNANPRPANCEPYLLVIHNISLPPNQFTGGAVVQFFQNQLDFDAHPWFENIRGVTVSTHFFIRRDGQVVQCVSTEQRAWHAGLSCFENKSGCNDFSIGIELEGADHIPYALEQYQQLAALTQLLAKRYPIRAIRGHEHIAPGRKTDPGPSFDWWYYANQCSLPLRFFPE